MKKTIPSFCLISQHVANSTASDAFYMGHPDGQYEHQMNAVTFTHLQGSVHAKVMVTQDICTLVGEVVYDVGDASEYPTSCQLLVTRAHIHFIKCS
jgi:hypothetical protein